MRTSFRVLPFALLILGGLLLVACGGAAGQGDPDAGGAQGSAVERPDPPENYAGLSNPLQADPEVITEGEILYQANCSSCHGPAGQGDGPAAAGLEPPPTDLQEVEGSLSDAYLYWRIAEGGLIEPFNSVMPAWRGILSEEQIWQIVTFLRSLGT